MEGEVAEEADLFQHLAGAEGDRAEGFLADHHREARALGEEAVETIIAGTSEGDEALRQEAADLLYHLLVLLECRGVAIGDVLQVLEGRAGLSGLKEKADRAKR